MPWQLLEGWEASKPASVPQGPGSVWGAKKSKMLAEWRFSHYLTLPGSQGRTLEGREASKPASVPQGPGSVWGAKKSKMLVERHFPFI